MIEDCRIYSAREIAKVLRVRLRTVYKMVEQNRIPYFRATENSQIRFAGWRIKQWITDDLIVNPKRKEPENESA